MENTTGEKNKKIIVGAVFILATFLITFHFTDTPMPWVDEGLFTETAKNLAMHGVLGVQTAPGQFFPMNNFLLSVSYPVIFPIAGTFLLFGTGIWQARLTMIAYMFLLVVAFYLFTKKRYGFKPAITSVLLLLSFSPFYGNGRPVQGEVPGLAWMVLGGWLLLLWEEGGFKSAKKALLAGLAFGLAAVIKPIFLVGVPVSLAIASILYFRGSLLSWISNNRRQAAIFVSGLFLPIMGWVYIHLPTWAEAGKFIPNYIYFSGNHDNPSISAVQNILINFKRFFTESTPVLFAFLMCFILVAIVLMLTRKENKRFSIAEYVIFIFLALNWVGYLKGTGWYRYFFPANTLAYLFFPAAVAYLSSLTTKIWLKRSLLAMTVILIIFQFTHLVFYSDTNFVSVRDRTPELTKALSGIRPDQSVMFYASVEAPIFLKGDNYTQFLAMGGFLDTGNRDIIKNPTADFLLIRGHGGYEFPCYSKKEINRYDFFEKINDCKK